jgi:hypothetical protein
MPRLISRNPAYRKHRASGQAVVTLDGKDFYLGPWNTKTSRNEYDRLIGEYLANGRRMDAAGGCELVVDEILTRFDLHAVTYYVDAEGQPTAHLGHFRRTISVSPTSAVRRPKLPWR